jgi:hypothetical protein
MKHNAQDEASYRESMAWLRRYDPRYSVAMTGENEATIAVQRRFLVEDGPDVETCEWFDVCRPSATGYWRRYNEKTGEWRQLFGRYSYRGAAMEGKLPGRHVKSVDDLPEKTE